MYSKLLKLALHIERMVLASAAPRDLFRKDAVLQARILVDFSHSIRFPPSPCM